MLKAAVPLAVFLAVLFGATRAAFPQELEPRAYRALPIGLNFIVPAYSFSSGNVVVDPTTPIEDLEIEIQTTSVSYLRTFGVFGRSASFTVSAPFIFVSASGRLEGEFREGSRSGWADARARLTVNLLGGPAMSLEEYADFRQGRAMGVGLTISMPTGVYDSSRIINFGANRWGFKPEIGYSSVRGKWIFDIAVGAWLFTTNHDGPGGTTKRQDPIGAAQGHVSYNFPRGLWLALDVNYFAGGRSTVDGEEQRDLQRNSRVGLTLSIPLKTRHSLKLATHTGAFTRIGADFDMATIAYQFRWGGD